MTPTALGIRIPHDAVERNRVKIQFDSSFGVRLAYAVFEIIMIKSKSTGTIIDEF